MLAVYNLKNVVNVTIRKSVSFLRKNTFMFRIQILEKRIVKVIKLHRLILFENYSKY